jgi:peptidoglycan/xylan/chitin deacetylase (PgdA/CDA1 family)
MQRKLILLTAALFVALAGCSDKENPQQEKEGKVLLLMYHRIVSGDPANEYERNVVALETDLKYLKDNSINVISFNDLNEYVTAGKMPPGNSVIITFDDGDHSWYTLVKPLLLKYNMKATFFLIADLVGHDSFIAWDEVENMSFYTPANGERPFMFGSHTYSHVFLLQSKAGFDNTADYEAFLDYQLGQSKVLIDKHVPVGITAMSLPFGDGAGDPDIIAAAKRNGYKFIRTSTWENLSSPAVDLYNLPSLPILDTTTTKFIRYYLNQ